MILTVQYEVAKGFALRQEPKLLALGVQVFGVHNPCSDSCWAFYPPPKVDSAIIRIDLFQRQSSRSPPGCFLSLAQAGFSKNGKLYEMHYLQECI
jgi:16S rRNA (adenine1518-N6/adenine1519-N6)-dimethyltransferase